jgi:hypothetical protein
MAEKFQNLPRIFKDTKNSHVYSQDVSKRMKMSQIVIRAVMMSLMIAEPISIFWALN